MNLASDISEKLSIQRYIRQMSVEIIIGCGSNESEQLQDL